MSKGNRRIWRWLFCITLILYTIGYICLARNRVETDIIDGEYIASSEENEEEIESGKKSRDELADSRQRGKHLRGNWSQIMPFVEEQLPELDDIGYYIEQKTEGKASLIVDIGAGPIELYDGSYITGSHEFSITYYDGEPFVEEEPEGTCLDMRPLFISVETGLREIDHDLETQFLKVLSAEKETIHEWYLEKLYIELGTILEKTLAAIQKDDGIGVYYGGYMEELRMIGRI